MELLYIESPPYFEVKIGYIKISSYLSMYRLVSTIFNYRAML
jgi:hypothetical protein